MKPTKTRDLITHEEWQTQIIQLAQTLGWRHLHVRRSVGRGRKWTTATNVIGWPDLWLWHPTKGFAAIEVKVHPDKTSPEQTTILKELQQAGARIMVPYPEDLGDLVVFLRAP